MQLVFNGDKRMMSFNIKCKTRDDNSFVHTGVLKPTLALVSCFVPHRHDTNFPVGLGEFSVLRSSEQIACTLVAWPTCKSLLFRSVRRRNTW